MQTDDRSMLHHRGLVDITTPDGLHAVPLAFMSEPSKEVIAWRDMQLNELGITLKQAIVDQMLCLEEQGGDEESERLAAERLDSLMYLIVPDDDGTAYDWIITDRAIEEAGIGMESQWVTADAWDKHHDLVKADIIGSWDAFVAAKAETVSPWFAHQDGPNNMRDGLTERQRHDRMIHALKMKAVELEAVRDLVKMFDPALSESDMTPEQRAESLQDQQREALDQFERLLFPCKEVA